MARNEWINGYLEAILDVGSGTSKLRATDHQGGGGNSNEDKSSNRIKSNLGKRFDDKLKFEKFEGKLEKDDKLFSPTKYFVEEVVNSFDESDLHRTWIKVI